MEKVAFVILHYNVPETTRQCVASVRALKCRVIKKIVSMYKDYRPRRFFFIIAGILIILGFIVGTPVIVEYFETRYIHKLPSAVLATGIVTLGIIVAQCGAILDTIVKQHRESFENRLLKYEEMENLKKKLQD